VHVVPRTGRRVSFRMRLRALITGQPPSAVLYSTEQMRSMLKALVSCENPDLVLVQFPQMAHYVFDCGDVPTVMDVQDSYSVSIYRAAQAEHTRLRRIRALRGWLTWVAYEKRVYARFNDVLVLTDQDRYGLTLFSPTMRVTVCRPAMEIPTRERTFAPIDGRIVYVGLLSRRPNIEAVEYFLSSVFPLVQRHMPDSTVLIAGRGAPSRLLQAYQSERTKFLGFVEDLDRLLQEASVVVAPLLSGGGIKIKVLEAMARGCPVVTTSIGAEDIGAVDGEDILVADNAESFAASVVSVMRDASLRCKLGKNAAELVRKRFSWAPRSSEFEQRLLRHARKNSARTPQEFVEG